MDIEEHIKEVEVTQHEGKCPECGRVFGPDTESRVRSQLASHYYSQHT